jgi:hypothetical protein
MKPEPPTPAWTKGAFTPRVENLGKTADVLLIKRRGELAAPITTPHAGTQDAEGHNGRVTYLEAWPRVATGSLHENRDSAIPMVAVAWGGGVKFKSLASDRIRHSRKLLFGLMGLSCPHLSIHRDDTETGGAENQELPTVPDSVASTSMPGQKPRR